MLICRENRFLDKSLEMATQLLSDEFYAGLPLLLMHTIHSILSAGDGVTRESTGEREGLLELTVKS